MRKLIARFKVRALERELQEQNETLLHVRGRVHAVLLTRREETQAELAKARAHWVGFFAPGVRFTWGLA